MHRIASIIPPDWTYNYADRKNRLIQVIGIFRCVAAIDIRVARTTHQCSPRPLDNESIDRAIGNYPFPLVAHMLQALPKGIVIVGFAHSDRARQTHRPRRTRCNRRHITP